MCLEYCLQRVSVGKTKTNFTLEREKERKRQSEHISVRSHAYNSGRQLGLSFYKYRCPVQHISPFRINVNPI